MYFRFILVNVFSFIKRFFAFNATIYNAIVFIPLFTVLSTRISKRAIFFIIIISLLLLLRGNIGTFVQFLLYFMLLLSVPMFKKVEFEKLLNRSFIFFIIVCLYGISQKLFGYTAIEINWIRSGLSFAEERAFIASNDIRPFSTFASMPEFTLFIAVFLYHFKIKQKKWLLLFAFIMLYISGSRGMLVATLTAYVFTFIFRMYKRQHLIFSFFASLLIFIFLVFLFPIVFDASAESSRMLAYGSFNGRIELLKSMLDKSSLLSLFLGVDLSGMGVENSFDNLYFLLIANFGLFGGLYFLLFLINQKINRKSFYFLSIFLGYGFYADMIFSYYLMFLFFFAMYSRSTVIESRVNLEHDTPKKTLSISPI